jgi:hypothetical protein
MGAVSGPAAVEASLGRRPGTLSCAVIQALTIVGVSIVITAVVAFIVLSPGKGALELDPEFRVEESRTGRCAACQGAGTRLEVRAGPTASTLARVTCFRCGGSGEPPPDGVVRQAPKDFGPAKLVRIERDWWSYKRIAFRNRLHR